MNERWKPGIGQAYWVVDLCYNKKVRPSSWANDYIDNNCYSCNNCFKTEAEAQAAAEKVKALLLSLYDNSETLQDSIQDKQLPDWCKVGEWVWCIDSEEYAKIKSIDDNGTLYFNDDKYHNVYARPARLRPWMPEEAIGKVVYVSKCYYLITSADEFMAKAGAEFIRLDKLAERYFQPDSSPCGKLEHLENGEWVE